ncbi:MAG: Ref family recombination enhancement nuclease [Sinimarinibacterium flocculans]|uniref:Ref family recombination enhancement nuclease n=1 Tax=Sinimarinibacterium flocculans TaxID=985250 RepID=UPI003C45DF9F
MQSTRLPAPNAAQQERFRRMYQVGCICCRLVGLGHVECQINHHLSGGRRISHDATTGECPWHHVGEPPAGMTPSEARAAFGPSRKLESRLFHVQFGSDEQLLAFQNRLIDITPAPRTVGRRYRRSSKLLPPPGAAA